MKRILPLAVLASFATSAPSSPELPRELAPHALTWPGAHETTAFTRAVAGQFDGDGIPDVVQLRGDKAVLFVSPAVFDTEAILGSAGQQWSVIDADVLKGAGANGTDALIYLNAQGLHIGRYDAAASSFDVAFTRGDVDAIRWVGAQRVRAADLNADGAPDLVGVASDGLTILQLLNDGQGHFTEVTDLTYDDAIVDVVTLQWDLDAPLEIAVLNVRGVIVSEQNGTVREARPKIYTPGDSITVIGQTFGANPQRQRVAWVRRSLDDTHSELLAFGTANALEGPYSIGPDSVRAIAAGDVDRDGDLDVLVSMKQGKDLVTVTNERSLSTPTAASFAGVLTQTRTIVDAQNPPLDSFATPLFVDLDNDSCADAFTVRSTISTTYGLLLPAHPVDPPATGPQYFLVSGHPAFGRADFVSSTLIHYETSFPHECPPFPPVIEHGVLFLELDKNAWAEDLHDATELEISGWSQPGWADVPVTPPDNLAYEHRIYPLSDPQIVIDCPSSGDPYPCTSGGNLRVAISFPEISATFSTCYFLQVRLRSVQGITVTNYRTFIASFTGDFSNGAASSGACDYLIAQQGAWPGSIPYLDHHDVPCPKPEKVHHLGGFVPQSRMPHFAPGFAPQVPSVVIGPPIPEIHAPPYTQ